MYKDIYVYINRLIYVYTLNICIYIEYIYICKHIYIYSMYIYIFVMYIMYVMCIMYIYIYRPRSGSVDPIHAGGMIRGPRFFFGSFTMTRPRGWVDFL